MERWRPVVLFAVTFTRSNWKWWGNPNEPAGNWISPSRSSSKRFGTTKHRTSMNIPITQNAQRKEKLQHLEPHSGHSVEGRNNRAPVFRSNPVKGRPSTDERNKRRTRGERSPWPRPRHRSARPKSAARHSVRRTVGGCEWIKQNHELI